MRGGHSVLAGTVAALVLSGTPAVLLPAPARAGTPRDAAPTPLTARSVAPAHPGAIALDVHGPDGAGVTVMEPARPSAPATTAVLAGGRAMIARAAVWRCDDRARRLTVSDGAQTVTVTVTTPSCRDRLRLAAPARVRSGATATVRAVDRWAAGDLSLRLCTSAPGARADCHGLVHHAGDRQARLRLRVRRPGRWLITARTPYGHATRTVTVRPRSGRLRVLAAGDSEMQLIDEFLAASLGSRARVHSDARISTGISSPRPLFDWVAHARRQAPSLRPDVTVMFIGGNDGFALPGPSGAPVACCGDAWVAAFAARARTMMKAYARGGAGRVYWFLLPAPRGGLLQRYFRAINRGYRLAAAGLADDVRLIDAAHVFTPHGYRDTMTWKGRTFTVHESDGYHLTIPGDHVATQLVLSALRADRML